MPKLTVQQEAAIDAVDLELGNLLLEARAGTGKTYTLCEAAQHLTPGARAIALAFNKTIATELQTRMPEFVLAKTLNGLGMGACYKGLRTRPQLDKKKAFSIQQSLGMVEDFPGLRQALNVAREWAIVPNNTPGDPTGVLDDSPDNWNRLFRTFNIDTGEAQDPIAVCRDALRLSIKEAHQGKIDFADQKYIPAIYNFPMIKSSFVMVDEAQDLSPLDKLLVSRLLTGPAPRLMAVGDPFQAIYGFRGADRNSIPNLIADYDPKILPLTVSFRCAKAIITEAQTVVPDIEALPDAPDGEVKELSELSLDEVSVPDGSAFLCRNNRPLVALFFKLLRANRNARIRGRDIAESLKSMLRSTKQRGLQPAWNQASRKAQIRMSQLVARNEEAQADALRDQLDCLELLIKASRTSSVWDFCKYLDEEVFNDESRSPIMLSSIHKAKGLEWPQVFILDPDLMPSKWAKTPEEIQQEKNLSYVAITRAQLVLNYISSLDIRA